jgi:phosphatidylserine synthase
MLDHHVRPVKDRLLAPLARVLAPRVHPNVLSVAGMAAAVGAAGLVTQGEYGWALASWGASRILDGVDGIVARLRGPTAFGGYLDLLLDGVGYAAIPLAFALVWGTQAGWILVALLLATYYLNILSWGVLAAFAAGQMAGQDPGSSTAHQPAAPGIPLPRGLVEGTETVVLYAAALLFPDFAFEIFTLMAILVALTVMERILHARQVLRGPD